MSDEKEPVAWHVIGDDFEYATLLEEHARAVAEEENGTVTPLYRLPTLTAAEREAVENCIYASERIGDDWSDKQAATLRGLLERMR
jgi:hypothetical protein